VTGIVNDTEDSDVSLLIVNDEYDTMDDGTDVEANPATPEIPHNSDGTVSNPVLDVGTEVTVSETAGSLSLSANSSAGASETGAQDAVVVTRNDANCPRHRRHSHRHRRSVIGCCLVSSHSYQ